MRIAIIGGSAHSTPALFRYFSNRKQLLSMEVRLVGRTHAHLAAVQHAVKTLTWRTPIPVLAFGMSASEIAFSLENIDLVLIQVRYGGFEGRGFDETFSLRYGYCGDEGLGPGGLSAAWRSWPHFRSLLRLIRDVAGSAYVILLSSPLSLLVRLASREFPDLNVFGICELPWTTLQEICRSMGFSALDVAFDYMGVNHIGWFFRLVSQGRDLVSEYASCSSSSEGGFPSAELIRACSGIPTKYLRMHYRPDDVLKEQKHQLVSRAAVLQQMAARSRAAYLSGDEPAIIAALERRRAPWYEHAVGPLLEALSGVEIEIPFFLSRSNGGIEPEWKDDDVLEIAHTVHERRLRPRAARSPVPKAVGNAIGAYVEYERLAAEAILRRNADGLSRSLKAHPWMIQSSVIPDLVREITASPSYDGV
jgi:6-phospho-beta-glucosidase